jgi:hypothetical protein
MTTGVRGGWRACFRRRGDRMAQWLHRVADATPVGIVRDKEIE